MHPYQFGVQLHLSGPIFGSSITVCRQRSLVRPNVRRAVSSTGTCHPGSICALSIIVCQLCSPFSDLICSSRFLLLTIPHDTRSILGRRIIPVTTIPFAFRRDFSVVIGRRRPPVFLRHHRPLQRGPNLLVLYEGNRLSNGPISVSSPTSLTMRHGTIVTIQRRRPVRFLRDGLLTIVIVRPSVVLVVRIRLRVSVQARLPIVVVSLTARIPSGGDLCPTLGGTMGRPRCPRRRPCHRAYSGGPPRRLNVF